MKKLFSLSVLMVLAIFASSCSNDDDESSQNLIVGSWEISQVEMTVSSDEGTTTETYTTNSCASPFIITFTTSGDALAPSETEIVDQSICPVDESQDDGTWEFISGNEYIITDEDGEAINFTITFSNDNTTIKLVDINDQTDDEFDPFTQTITLTGNKI